MDTNAYLDGQEFGLNGQVCGNCKHWERMAEEVGAYRRYPPVVIFDTNLNTPVATNPRTLQDDTCGEHLLKDGK